MYRTLDKKRNHIKQKFRQRGQTFTDWAQQHGYEPRKVIRVLNGFDKGHYGQAHEIAVALGLKPAPDAATNPNQRQPL